MALAGVARPRGNGLYVLAIEGLESAETPNVKGKPGCQGFSSTGAAKKDLKDAVSGPQYLGTKGRNPVIQEMLTRSLALVESGGHSA